MEGTYELFDYVLTVNAGEISSTDAALTGIGYNPVATAIVVGNDGGKLIVGYGMQTKTIAIGFVLAYMTQGSAVACTPTTAAISGYNTLVPRNQNDDATNASGPITTAAMCATNTTWVFQAARSNATGCMAWSCHGVSQPFFGLAEDWAYGDGAGATEYYVLGALEYACDQLTPSLANCPAPFGNGAYEVRMVKLDKDGTAAWDSGQPGGGAGNVLSKTRSNCEVPAGVAPVATGIAPCDRRSSHSAFLTGVTASTDYTGNTAHWLTVGGVTNTSQSPLMYKNGW
jgi:hypothetical protein